MVSFLQKNFLNITANGCVRLHTFKSSNPVSFNRKLVNGNYSLVLFPANWTDEDLFYAPSVEGKVWEDMLLLVTAISSLMIWGHIKSEPETFKLSSVHSEI